MTKIDFRPGGRKLTKLNSSFLHWRPSVLFFHLNNTKTLFQWYYVDRERLITNPTKTQNTNQTQEKHRGIEILIHELSLIRLYIQTLNEKNIWICAHKEDSCLS